MKGYTNVERSVIRSAMTNWKYHREQGKAIRDKGVDMLYKFEYTHGSWLTKRLWRSGSKIDFARRNIGMFGNWSDVLKRYLDDDELEILEDWSWGAGRAEYAACEALLNASGMHVVTLDHELCRWVNKHR